MIRPTLFIFAKAPMIGKAKTRLAADIGKVHALRLYRSMLSRVIRNVQSPAWDTVIMVTPAHKIGHVPEWQGLAQYPQVNGSLTPRLAQAFAHKGPVIVIGTDCPQIRERDIANGFKALRSHKAVFGPADDGGFYLMGMNGPVSEAVFDNVRWSTEHTLADVEKNVRGPVKYLRTLVDIDDLKALKQVRGSGSSVRV